MIDVTDNNVTCELNHRLHHILDKYKHVELDKELFQHHYVTYANDKLQKILHFQSKIYISF